MGAVVTASWLAHRRAVEAVPKSSPPSRLRLQSRTVCARAAASSNPWTVARLMSTPSRSGSVIVPAGLVAPWRPHMPVVDMAIDPASPTHVTRRGMPDPPREPRVLPLPGTAILSRWRVGTDPSPRSSGSAYTHSSVSTESRWCRSTLYQFGICPPGCFQFQ